jgi:hypothetical protein
VARRKFDTAPEDGDDWYDDYDDFALYGDVPAPRYAGGEGLAGHLLDEVIPGGVDWRRLVADYPVPVLAVAALGGYFLGRHRGRTVVGAVTALAANHLAKSFRDTLGERSDDLSDEFDDD